MYYITQNRAFIPGAYYSSTLTLPQFIQGRHVINISGKCMTGKVHIKVETLNVCRTIFWEGKCRLAVILSHTGIAYTVLVNWI